MRESNLVGVQLCHTTSPPTLTSLVYHTPHKRMPITLSIPCISCQDAATECIPSLHTKSSCARCSINNLQCVFTSSVWHLSHNNNTIQFSCNCGSCTQRHRQCCFAGSHLSKCSRCIQYCLPCIFTLSGEYFCVHNMYCSH